MEMERHRESSCHGRIVFVTAGKREVADKLARVLVGERLAACVSIVDGVTSIYRWEGEVVEDRELLLIIKTWNDRFEELKARILAEHPYQVPEIVALPLEDGHQAYLEWVQRETRV